MKINHLTPSKEVLFEMGRRLAKIRKQRKISQDTLATEAGIGVATLRRIESGRDGQFESWIKILFALGLSHSIDSLIPEEIRSPMDDAKNGRRRESAKRDGIVWGDEAE